MKKLKTSWIRIKKNLELVKHSGPDHGQKYKNEVFWKSIMLLFLCSGKVYMYKVIYISHIKHACVLLLHDEYVHKNWS